MDKHNLIHYTLEIKPRPGGRETRVRPIKNGLVEALGVKRKKEG